MEIHLGSFYGFVPQPERDHGAIDAMLKQVHGGGVAKYMRGDFLPLERRAGLLGNMGVLGDETLDRIAAKSAATDAGKDRLPRSEMKNAGVRGAGTMRSLAPACFFRASTVDG